MASFCCFLASAPVAAIMVKSRGSSGAATILRSSMCTCTDTLYYDRYYHEQTQSTSTRSQRPRHSVCAHISGQVSQMFALMELREAFSYLSPFVGRDSRLIPRSTRKRLFSVSLAGTISSSYMRAEWTRLNET
ncbi:hypothetical protein V8C37DRAFT_365161 [Trichoderma ceciliae]